MVEAEGGRWIVRVLDLAAHRDALKRALDILINGV